MLSEFDLSHQDEYDDYFQWLNEMSLSVSNENSIRASAGLFFAIDTQKTGSVGGFRYESVYCGEP
jgi:hypothetical protein